jgi:hypothetical protein
MQPMKLSRLTNAPKTQADENVQDSFLFQLECFPSEWGSVDGAVRGLHLIWAIYVSNTTQ